MIGPLLINNKMHLAFKIDGFCGIHSFCIIFSNTFYVVALVKAYIIRQFFFHTSSRLYITSEAGSLQVELCFHETSHAY